MGASLNHLIFILWSICITLLNVTKGCPDQCICNEVTIETNVIVYELFCTTLPESISQQTENLTITGKMSSISLDSLSRYYNLPSLNLTGLTISSWNGTGKMPNLEHLYLSNNNLLNLGEKSFQWCINLVKLDLSWNNLKAIDSRTFSSLTHLKYLNLGNNNLFHVELKLPLSLVTLDLSHNELETVPVFEIYPLLKLNELNLCGNAFISFNLSPEIAPNLNSLCLGDFLNTVEPQCLSNLMRLSTLKISGKAVLNESIATELAQMRTLQILSLSSYDIASINKDLFNNGLQSLRELHLIGVKSSGLEAGALSNLPNLKLLNLDGSSELAKSFLFQSPMGLNELETLMIADTATSTLDPTTFPIGTLKYLDISYNPLVCDQGLQVLIRDLLHGKLSLLNQDKTLCYEPKNLTGLELLDLQTVNRITSPTAEEIRSVNCNADNQVNVVKRTDGIYFYINKYNITTDDLLYTILGLMIAIVLLIMLLIVVGYLKYQRNSHKKCYCNNDDSTENFVMRADDEYVFDNFTLSDTLAESRRNNSPSSPGGTKSRKTSSSKGK